MPESKSAYAAWGIAAHDLLRIALEKKKPPLEFDTELIVHEGVATFYKNDVQEMQEAAQPIYEYVQQRLKEMSESFLGLEVETRSDPGKLIGRSDCWGTADVVIRWPGGIEVIDAKFGQGVIVEPTDPQLFCYALGKMKKDTKSITLTIAQPRAFHPKGPIRSITVDEYAMAAFCEVLKKAAAATDDPDAQAVPSEDGCRFCRYAPKCPELAAVALERVQQVFQPVPIGGSVTQLEKNLTREPSELALEQRAFILQNEALISGWLKRVKDFATEEEKQGRHTPGFKLVSGRGSRDWSLEEKLMAKQLKRFRKKDGKALGKKDIYTESFVSPAQAEKRIKSNVTAETWTELAKFIVSQPGSPTLVPETDPRSALPTAAKEIFKPVEQKPKLPEFLL